MWEEMVSKGRRKRWRWRTGLATMKPRWRRRSQPHWSQKLLGVQNFPKLHLQLFKSQRTLVESELWRSLGDFFPASARHDIF